MKSSTISDLPRLFIDTWGWLVLEDARDPRYLEVHRIRRQYAEARRLWVTTDFVLDETITRLFARRPFGEAEEFCAGIFEEAKLGLLAVERITPERFEKAYALRLRYRDKPRISFTDLTSFAVMRELGLRHVLTADTHFAQAHLGFHKVP
ncbi:MAG TPA: PIN domain-containing protein [Bryobacterales bacterium]|nr:PIN domain-containing protein [Bryobacterales bacterium]